MSGHIFDIHKQSRENRQFAVNWQYSGQLLGTISHLQVSVNRSSELDFAKHVQYQCCPVVNLEQCDSIDHCICSRALACKRNLLVYLRKFLVAHQSQKYWLLCDCPSVCMSLHPLHINQCEMSICKKLVPKAFPSPRSFGFTAFNRHLSKQSIS